MKQVKEYGMIAAVVFAQTTHGSNEPIISTNRTPQQAVCVVCVADLVGTPFSSKKTHFPAKNYYDAMPAEGQTPDLVHRTGQLLFNEVVTIVATDTPHAPEEVCIQSTSHYYCTRTDSSRQTTYWTLSKNLMPLTQLDNSSKIPTPLSYADSAPDDEDVLTLREPFFDPITHRRYAAGTRFLLHYRQPQNGNYYRVWVLNQHAHNVTMRVPKECALRTRKLSPDQKIELFLSLLDQYAKCSPGYVPYVFGGMAYTGPYEEPFTTHMQGDKKYFHIAKPHRGPYCGLDCTALIMRLAQMAGLPFWCRNSSAMKHHIRPLHKDETLEPGDLVFVAGHVVVLVDHTHIIESRSQLYGYGRVQKINLEQEFAGIHHAHELETASRNHTLVDRLDSTGKTIQQVPITLLKLRSIFEK